MITNLEKTALGALISVGAIGCGVLFDRSEDAPRNSTESYTYEYEVNGCNTGKHTFDAKEKMCEALLNDRLNNDCAFSLRIERYVKECDPTYQAPVAPIKEGRKEPSESTPINTEPSSSPVLNSETKESNFGSVYIDVQGKISLTSVPKEDSSRSSPQFYHVATIEVNSWKSREGFKDSIPFDKARLIRLKDTNLCNYISSFSAQGLLSASGASVMQINIEASDLCGLELRNGYFALEMFDVTSMSGKTIERVILNFEASE